MRLSELHLLLTYECNLECDHCFAWGSPKQNGTMSLKNLREILQQAKRIDTLKWIYVEGGEPFLYYPILLKAVKMSAALDFSVGIVSNGYWATAFEDAEEWMKPFAGFIQDFSMSSDLYHWTEKLSQQAMDAKRAAELLDIPLSILTISQPEETCPGMTVGKLRLGESAVMYRGRAAEKLAPRAAQHCWESFTKCPYEDLQNPERVHLDPFGSLQVCQGISLGNVFDTPLVEIGKAYDPVNHPIIGPLLEGGPVELVRRYRLPHEQQYADACHLCYKARQSLRAEFPDILMPDQMYGVLEW